MRKITLFLFMSILSVSMVMADSKQTVTVNGSAVGKSATRLTFSGDNITLTYTDGTSQSADMSNVNLAFDYVANFKSTDFDNSVTIKTFGGKTMTAEVTMTLRSGQWQAICLPFDMNASLISTVFGNNTQVAALESATNAGINFATTTDMTAGVPYLIKPAIGLTRFTIDNVTISTTTGANSVNGDNFNWQGVYNTDYPTGDIFTISDDFSLTKLTSGSPVNGLGAYLRQTVAGNSPTTFTVDGTSGLLGDANGDGNVNVVDVMLVVDYILSTMPPSASFFFMNADVNGDDNISVVDAMAIVNIILTI